MERWQVLYPIYFNKEFSWEKGRRAPVQRSVQCPDVETIMAVLKELNIESIYEEKRHPADYFGMGRVKYRRPAEQIQMGELKLLTKKQLISFIGKRLAELQEKQKPKK